VVVLTGAGVSAESGLQTFRDAGGLWGRYALSEVATPEAWARDPALVLAFYNERRRQARAAAPNPAHRAIAALEQQFEVVVITQNVDDLHERAGSTTVIHVHGELVKARSTLDESLVYPLDGNEIRLGDTCEKGGQLRPHIVWFGEAVQHYESAAMHLESAGKVLVVGTSLSVYPVAGLLDMAPRRAEKIIVSLDLERVPPGYDWLRGPAAQLVPELVERWRAGRPAVAPTVRATSGRC